MFKLSKTSKTLILIIILASFFRLYGLNWDQGQHFHPDERMITMVTEKITWQDLNPHFFAYGSFPIYLLKIACAIAGIHDYKFATYDSINLVGRLLSTLFDLGTLIVLFFLGKKLINKETGLLASFCYAISVLPIQLSHFYAVDTPLTFFILLTLYFLIQFLDHPKLKWSILIGLCFGLSLATKTSALLLIIPIGITIFLKFSLKKIPLLILIPLISLITFFVFMPFAFIDSSTFWRQTLEQQRMTNSAFTFPYTLQYFDKVPYLYELQNIFFWGLGPILATFSFLGALFFTYKTFRPTRNAYYLILTIYFYLYFGIVGHFAIGFMRYMLPLYPLLCLFTAIFFNLLIHYLQSFIKNKKILNYTLYPITCTLILIWPLSFISIYSQPNTRNSATIWINQNIPQGSVIAVEHWDDGLPVNTQSNYQVLELPMYNPDSSTLKWQKVNNVLQNAEYIIIASNRLYTPLQKMTDCASLPLGRCYNKTAQYYQDLFSGKLGFTKIAEFSDYPTIPLLNHVINDFSADESFTVYDHPKIMILKNVNINKLLRSKLRSIPSGKFDHCFASSSQQATRYSQSLNKIKTT